jgi:hypothetical protein
LDVGGQKEFSEHVYDSLMRILPMETNVRTRLFFNAACNLSRQGKAEKALEVLDKLYTFNPGKIRETRSDPDFDNVRMYPRYVKLMDAVGSQ